MERDRGWLYGLVRLLVRSLARSLASSLARSLGEREREREVGREIERGRARERATERGREREGWGVCVCILLSILLSSCLAVSTVPPVSLSSKRTKKIPVRATVMGVVRVECSGL